MREERRGKGDERKEKRAQKRSPEIPKRGRKRSQKRSQEASGPRGAQTACEGGMVKKGLGPPKNTNELPRVCFPNVLKIRGCYEDGRQVESLYFYKVP